MLQHFLVSHHHELIERCREKVTRRFAPNAVPEAIDRGVPILLQQISDSLWHQQRSAKLIDRPESLPEEIEQTAAAHGAELLRLGYTIDQVVHDYGDVCQSVTELAIERNAPVDTAEFHTLNLCLDEAIASAVTAFTAIRQDDVDIRASTLRSSLAAYSAEHRRLVDIAVHAFAAIRTGDVAVTGATGKLLVHSLQELRTLAERNLPQIQLLSEANTSSG